ncbi:hypothetical protein D3C87_1677170 [compost metagenome]
MPDPQYRCEGHGTVERGFRRTSGDLLATLAPADIGRQRGVVDHLVFAAELDAPELDILDIVGGVGGYQDAGTVAHRGPLQATDEVLVISIEAADAEIAAIELAAQAEFIALDRFRPQAGIGNDR